MTLSIALRLCAAALLCLPQVSNALDPPRKQAAKTATAGPREIGWNDLLPPAERDELFAPSQRVRPLFDDESGPPALQEGSAAANRELDKQEIRIPGFVVPLAVDENVLVTEFL